MYSTAYIIGVISGTSISIAAIIAIFRYAKLLPEYRPFIYLVWFSLFIEIISRIIAHYFRTNAAIANVFVLLESILILWQFFKWSEVNEKTKRIYIWVAMLFFLVWLLDNFIFHSLERTNSGFRVFTSFIIVSLCIEHINHVFMVDKNNILKNARFLICTALLIFFAYKAVFEVFYMVEVRMSRSFYRYLFYILLCVNLFCNLVFALAVLWIPTRRKFLLPF